MKINLSEFWAKERKHDGKIKQDIYLEKFLLFLSKYYGGKEDEKGGTCSRVLEIREA